MTWGLVLSGGAAWGLTNAGVLTALERAELRPDYVAGSSMGAIVGAIWSLGHPASVFAELCEHIRLWDIARLSAHPLKGGLHGGLLQQNLQHFLEPLLKDARIADCTIPFVCVAARVKEPIHWGGIAKRGFTDEVERKAELCVFPPETLLLDAVMASSAIPVLFSPYRIDGIEYGDLVHFGAIPARTLRSVHHPDIVIATNTNPPHDTIQKMLPAGWREFLERGAASLEESKRACDLIIEPVMPAAPWRFDKAQDFLRAGEKATEENLPQVRMLLTL